MDDDDGILLNEGKIIGSKWKIISKLGSGGFGAVYKVINLDNQMLAAIKCEKLSEAPLLKMEAKVLKELKEKCFVVNLIETGMCYDFDFLILELLGKSLDSMMKENESINESTQLRLAVQILYSLMELHNIGYIHRDLKPANFAMGRGKNARRVHMLDLGLARKFAIIENGKRKLLPERVKPGFRGTLLYASSNSCLSNEQNVSDDLWSFLYIIIEMNGPLPWVINCLRNDSNKEIGIFKKEYALEKLFKKCHTAFLNIAKYLNDLKTPIDVNYELMYELLKKAMQEQSYEFSDKYDWECIVTVNDPCLNYSYFDKAFGDNFCGNKKKKATKIKAPEDKDAIAGTHDPNYQTLNAVDGECFGADKNAGAKPKAPTDQNQVAGTHDPNYQTLAGVGGECFQDKGAGGGGVVPPASSPAPASPANGPKALAQGGIAGTHDPNYQTLAGMGQDCFGADKAAGGGGGGGGGGAAAPAAAGPKAPAQGGIAGTHDPNYQTLAGMAQSTTFFQTKTYDGTKILISDAVYADMKKMSENKFKHFNIYKSNDGSSFRIIFELCKKQVYSTTEEKEAYFVAQRLENLSEIGQEVVKSSLDLNKFIDIALEHQNWNQFQIACALGCIGYVSTMQSEQNQNDFLLCVTADTGELPFHLAISNKHLNVSNFLFGRGANPNAVDLKGNNAFHIAAQHFPEFLGNLMLAAENNTESIYGQNQAGKIPMALAVEKGIMESVKILTNKLDENGFRRMMISGFQPLHKPIQNTFKKEVADIIIEKSCAFIEIKNENQETPLFACIRNGDLAMVLHLIALGTNTEEKDPEGRNALEAAFAHEKIVFVKLFHSLGFAIDKDVLRTKCNVPSAMWSELDQILKELHTKNHHVIVSPIMEQMQNILVEEVLKPSAPKGLRILSLDGGGIRGIMSVIILKELESRLQQKCNNSEVLVAQFFNFIGGTSTGAMIALALAKGKSAFDILKLYIRFRDKVFCGKRPYDSTRLEEFLKQELGEETTLENLSKFPSLKLMVTTTKADVMPPELVLFRNYDIPGEVSSKNNKAWFAARCSSAAPTYFDSPKQIYLDGGLISNNPCSDILVELTKLDTTRQLSNQPPLPLACVVSIGTGRPPPKSTNAATISVPQDFGDILRNGCNQITGFMSLFINQICASDGAVVDRARALTFTKHSPFFRLSPELPTEVELDDKDDMIILDLMFAARCYLHQEEESLERLVTILSTSANL